VFVIKVESIKNVNDLLIYFYFVFMFIKNKNQFYVINKMTIKKLNLSLFQIFLQLLYL